MAGSRSDVAHTDHRQIEYLLYEYARRVDAADFSGVAAMFDEGIFAAARVERTGTEMTGAELGRVLRDTVILYDGTPRTRHVTTNVAIEVDGDAALATSYFTVLQQVPGQGVETVIAGHYDDTFERAETGWRFSRRTVHADLVGDISRHLSINPFT